MTTARVSSQCILVEKSGALNTLYEDKCEHVLAQVNFKMVKLAEENILRVQQGQNQIPLNNVTKLNLFFQMMQAEKMDPTRPALTPQTLRCGTFNFPKGFDENRDMGEEGEESFDRCEDGTMEDTPPVDDGTEGEHEGVSAQVLFTTQGMETEDNCIEADDTPVEDNRTDHTEPKGDINQGMEADDTPIQDNRTDHTEPEGDVNQGMEANDTPVQDNGTDQGMETDTDENVVESVEGNDTDNTIDYICGVELEIETEYERQKTHLFKGGFDIGF